MFILFFIVFAVAYLFIMNSMTNKFVTQREVPDEKQPKVFNTINVLVTILLVSSYVELLLAA
ncbi:hypothetical protein CHL76_04975 [Marinococcus halophilus]|uniref:Uncharacterized protein n=1 Tax=Marinococcus halophilus TaxID=1371 RepID=A0A510Y642_MARHA|nr:hypothetical protein [Marinococcus halophilus]OZT81123.1 hypothetical protein CHL76_04975 [Marinococcus halophilus]GEK58846.1 hypothetical protein MHA01_17510 [Marinococcus halophilus]